MLYSVDKERSRLQLKWLEDVSAELPEMLFSIAVILSFLTGKCSAEHLLHMSVEEVSAHNYTYYSLSYAGHIRLYLYSLEGDTDLYVSQYLAMPTYDPEMNCAQSTTCGLDIVDIPKSFTRPVGIGVYGHPSHEKSVYRLEVYYIDRDDEYVGRSVGNLIFHSSSPVESENIGVPKKRRPTDDSHDENMLWTFLFYLFEVAFDILFI